MSGTDGGATVVEVDAGTVVVSAGGSESAALHAATTRTRAMERAITRMTGNYPHGADSERVAVTD
jgi:cob(I)alamin adenosyltransferase